MSTCVTQVSSGKTRVNSSSVVRIAGRWIFLSGAKL
jgi:hypothetical protein